MSVSRIALGKSDCKRDGIQKERRWIYWDENTQRPHTNHTHTLARTPYAYTDSSHRESHAKRGKRSMHGWMNGKML